MRGDIRGGGCVGKRTLFARPFSSMRSIDTFLVRSHDGRATFPELAVDDDGVSPALSFVVENKRTFTWTDSEVVKCHRRIVSKVLSQTSA